MITRATSISIPVFILAGGIGTRLSEETHLKPKPMVEIGEIPILIHIMRLYYHYGFNNFVICAGYRSWEIKNYFLTYEFRMNHMEVDHRFSPVASATSFEQSAQEKWRVRVVDTGLDCMTGGRLARAWDLISKVESFNHFAVTYGDGLCDLDLEKEYQFHHSHKKIGTVLSVKPVGRFGRLEIDKDSRVCGFLEKPEDSQERINGGFFFFSKEFRKYLSSDGNCILEREPLEKLASAGELMTFRHSGFWHPMDTLRDKKMLDDIWSSGLAPWKKSEASTQTPLQHSTKVFDAPPVHLS